MDSLSSGPCAREQRRERYLNRRGSSTNNAKARVTDTLLGLHRRPLRGAVLVAAQLSRILVESDPELPVLIDGDVLTTTPVEFELIPDVVSVISPLERMSH